MGVNNLYLDHSRLELGADTLPTDLLRFGKMHFSLTRTRAGRFPTRGREFFFMLPFVVQVHIKDFTFHLGLEIRSQQLRKEPDALNCFNFHLRASLFHCPSGIGFRMRWFGHSLGISLSQEPNAQRFYFPPPVGLETLPFGGVYSPSQRCWRSHLSFDFRSPVRLLH